MRNDAGEHIGDDHRLQLPNGFQSDSAINANHRSVEGLKVHPGIHCSEMLLQPVLVSPFDVCFGEVDSNSDRGAYLASASLPPLFTVFFIEGRDHGARVGAHKEGFTPAGNDYPVEC